jgi:NTP pyrophosphatase (non-canonical NTP hydrolase)
MSKIETFSEYAAAIEPLVLYPRNTTIQAMQYVALGLNGEAGEVAEQIKKAMRNDDGNLSEERVDKLKKELGDVLWYLTRAAAELGTDLDEIARINVDKLYNRRDNDGLKHE